MINEDSRNIKAIGLLSGGLDSTLAVKLIIDQGINVTLLNFITPFCTCTKKGCKHEASRVADKLNVPIKIIAGGKEYIEMIKNPKHGYGSNMNPCIDCRIFMFKKAKKYMGEIGANFIFTGEVIGQRPMSQHRRAMKIIEQESELNNLIVRPLSARLLRPTIPEEKAWIDREKLLSIHGRRRIPQMELAERLGINDYPCPAGGCRLTDPGYAKRLKESLEHDEDSINDMKLLRYGRHFRLNSNAKVIVGRNEEENKILGEFLDKNDILMDVVDVGSPIVLLKKSKDKNDVKEAAFLCIRYSDMDKKSNAKIRINYGNEHEQLISFDKL